MLHKRLFICGILICSLTVLLFSKAPEDKTIQATKSVSPNGKYEVIVCDGTIRVMVLIDTEKEKVLFHHTTHERYTLIAWNDLSSKCAIMDAPDNANVFLEIVDKAAAWKSVHYDLSTIAGDFFSKTYPTDIENVFRSSIESVRWTNSSKLECVLWYHHFPTTVKYSVLFDTTKAPFKHVIKELEKRQQPPEK
jgi:hypothetical protein